MFSKQEAALLRQQFWTTLGQYLSLSKSSNGEKINWINYKTGVKYITFKTQADKGVAKVSIEVSHPDKDRRLQFFQTFQSLKQEFESLVPGTWHWVAENINEQKVISSIHCEMRGVEVYKREDWPQLITFFKSSLTGLDKFWNFHKDIFTMI